MDKTEIKNEVAKFITMASITEWNQEAHNAFVAWLIKREAALEPHQVETIMLMQQAMPSITANASAFRQWLESKDVALLKKAEPATKSLSRYAALINGD